MGRFLLAFAVAAAVAGAPVVLIACQTMCADVSGHELETAQHSPTHVCHDAVETSPSPATITAVDGCGHVDLLPEASLSQWGVVIAASPAPAASFMDSPEPARAQWLASNAEPAPPDQAARRSQLRL